MRLTKTTFDDAVAETADQRRHLLLGNGFSIAAHDAFAYASLKAEACKLTPAVAGIFDAGGVETFEDALAVEGPTAERKTLNQSLITTISALHPMRPSEVNKAQLLACARFLARFLRLQGAPDRGGVFTTSYDVMLPWVLHAHRHNLKAWDGFTPTGIWLGTEPQKTSVHYLHGGLHLYETGAGAARKVRKLQSEIASAKSLIELIFRSATGGCTPLMVTEGGDKPAKIRASRYLSAARDAFVGACNRPDDALFVFGHSLGDADRHIADVIGEGAIQRVYLSAAGAQDEDRLHEAAGRWAEQRAASGAAPIRAAVFDAVEAPVWAGR